MKTFSRISLMLVLLVTMLFSLIIPTAAHPNWDPYGDVPMYKGGILVDGQIDEAYKHLGLVIDCSVPYLPDQYLTDATATVYLLHDGEYLYAAIAVQDVNDIDPSKYPEKYANADGAYMGAGTEFYMDWDNKGMNFAKIMGWIDGRYWGSNQAKKKEDTYVAAYKTTYDIENKSYVLEFKCPFVNASVGSRLGFYVMITSNNDISKGGQDGIIAIDEFRANKPDLFRDIILSETEVFLDPSITEAYDPDVFETAAPTEAPTTAAPTEAPTTAAPTEAPTTVAPTEAPTTAAPVTEPAEEANGLDAWVYAVIAVAAVVVVAVIVVIVKKKKA